MDGDPEAAELVEDQHLVSEGTGQAVRGQAPHGVERPLLGRVAQGVQARTVKACPRATVVDELGHELISLRRDPGPQRL